MNGAPAITIDAGLVSPIVFDVRQSDFLLTRLRIVKIAAGRFAISIRAGQYFADPGPRRLTNVQIRDCVFSVPSTMLESGLAISAGMEDTAEGAPVDDVTIAGNTFRGFLGSDSVGVHVADRAARRTGSTAS